MNKFYNILVFAALVSTAATMAGGQTLFKNSIKSSLTARAIGMGDAFTAVIDGAASSLYNPASLGLYPFRKDNLFALYLNPVEAALAVKNYDQLSRQNSKSSIDWLNFMGLFTKSILYHFSALTSVLTLGEQLPGNPFVSDDETIFPLTGLLDWNYSFWANSLRLAKQISIGASGFLVTARGYTKREWSTGFSYGVILRPAPRLTFAMAYFDFEPDVAEFFVPEHHFIDESINIGCTFRPLNSLLFSVDIRNVSEDERVLTRELHVGSELAPLSFFAIRGGYYTDRILHQQVFSGGFSLLSNSLFRKIGQDVRVKNFLLNYAVRARRQGNAWLLQHYITLNLRI